MQTLLHVRTSGPGLYEFTDDVARFVRQGGIEQGLYVFEHRDGPHVRRVVAHLGH